MSQLTIEQAFQFACQHHEAGQLRSAEAIYKQILAQQPNHPGALHYLGVIAYQFGHNDIAVNLMRQAIALQPNYSSAYNNLGNALKDAGRMAESVAAYRQALALKPQSPDAHSNLVLNMHYQPEVQASEIAEEHRCWNRQHGEPLRQFIQPHSNDRNPERRLRIGYISADFQVHPVERFLLPLLASHDKSQVEIFAYAQVIAPDATTRQMRSYTQQWRSIVGFSDAQAADLIRQDGIDILVDLSGHTSGNRLLVMARKPAPIQVTYLGYPDTTGLSTIDYRLTDALADPPGQTERYHSEQLVRLPEGMWCYEPDAQAPPVTALPALAKGAVTFGSFNRWPKVNGEILLLWAKLLMHVPGSTLLLKDRALIDPNTRREAIKVLAGQGVSEDRVRILDVAPNYVGHLLLYQQMDIALDPFPYHGTTTTCEALWMGVPVITLAGRIHVSRVGVSLLNGIGLPELVAQTPEQYIQIAATLAGNLSRLNELRRGLRQRMASAPLTDAPRFARNVETAYRQMWKTWCKKQAANG